MLKKKIKEDKSLIQPLQSLYELVAKQSTTNEFLRTIISLFHTVIEETLVGNRRFLITILLKSMIRMLPFIEDGVGLLRDIQQFYQIGEMVYVINDNNLVWDVWVRIWADKEVFIRGWNINDSLERFIVRRWEFEGNSWGMVEHKMEE